LTTSKWTLLTIICDHSLKIKTMTRLGVQMRSLKISVKQSRTAGIATPRLVSLLDACSRESKKFKHSSVQMPKIKLRCTLWAANPHPEDLPADCPCRSTLLLPRMVIQYWASQAHRQPQRHILIRSRFSRDKRDRFQMSLFSTTLITLWIRPDQIIATQIWLFQKMWQCTMTVLLNGPHHSSGIDFLLITLLYSLHNTLCLYPPLQLFSKWPFFDKISNLNIISLCYEIPLCFSFPFQAFIRLFSPFKH